MLTTAINRGIRSGLLLVFTMTLLAVPSLAAGQPSGTAASASCRTRAVGAAAVPCSSVVLVSNSEKFDCRFDDCFVSGLNSEKQLKPPMYYEPLREMSGQWRLYLCHREPRATDSLGRQCDPFQLLETYDREKLAAYYGGRAATGFPKPLFDQLDFTKVSPPCSLLVWAKPDARGPYALSARFVIAAINSSEQETHRCLTGTVSPR